MRPILTMFLTVCAAFHQLAGSTALAVDLYFSVGSPVGSRLLDDGNRWNGIPGNGVFGNFDNNDGSSAIGVTVAAAADNASFDNSGNFDNIVAVPSDVSAGDGISTDSNSDVGRSIFWNSSSASAITVTISGLNPNVTHEVGFVIAAGGRPGDRRTYDAVLNDVLVLDEYDEVDGAAGPIPLVPTNSTGAGEISFEVRTGDFGPHALLNAFVVSEQGGILGDLNQDTFVDVADWNLLKPNFLLDTSELSTEAALLAGDFDLSGRVDLRDMSRFAQIFGEQSDDASLEVASFDVPEPSALNLLAVVVVGLIAAGLVGNRMPAHRFRRSDGARELQECKRQGNRALGGTTDSAGPISAVRRWESVIRLITQTDESIRR